MMDVYNACTFQREKQGVYLQGLYTYNIQLYCKIVFVMNWGVFRRLGFLRCIVMNWGVFRQLGFG